MSMRNVGSVCRKELREALRDRRTLISTLIVPLILFPLLTAGFAALAITLVGKAKEEVPRIMILGGEDSPQFVDGLRKNDRIVIAPLAGNWKDQIINKDIRAAVEIPPGFHSDVARQKATTLKIYIYEGDMKSSFRADRVRDYFKTHSDNAVNARLPARNVPDSALKPFDVK